MIKIRNTLMFCMIFVLISCASINKDEQNTESNRDIRKAALNCEIPKFSQFMDTNTAKRIARLQEVMDISESNKQSIYNKAKHIFKDDVAALPHGFRVIVNSRDIAWVSVIGPAALEKLNDPNAPPLDFRIEFRIRWKGECAVVQALQACLEDPAFCKETLVDESVLAMKNINDDWRLVFTQPEEEYQSSLLFVEKIHSAQAWLGDYLKGLNPDDVSEDMKLELATQYRIKMMQLMSQH